ncbi:hypothetical protein A3B45_00575 [Candidatus Daviesbacteria bacterium RIFCSPLOWO2_01_FULL_39_12]|uniref:Uncharacterized protein n=1 Tax=Candidatus Daviesbacteria bacterium RIFCSPLOWO2_01_FULL_39_12 TaxID=1797785 RepID=A0A1F5KMX2_9BACT|nr:MAG: hypothetical protein A3D79_02290 [Candidatus Daviesbacteria bacterium RIFCSPHIGHO2_02_FULL_39_8]OGE42135.1 MAG: hypothetical protein A3B45_00575 [Candidatus Daviesbacteria bacterium RIFCSPLOWO2_01_FULL_39_12]
MGKLRRGLAEASLAVIDQAISQIPDPVLKLQISTLSLAVKVPYFILRELLPTETDKFLKEVLESSKITKDVINSPEFQQALGSTLANLTYARGIERQEIIKKAFIGAYISGDDYAKNHLERLQETAESMSLPAIQHLAFIRREIFPIRDMDLKSKPEKSQKIGYTDDEYQGFLKRTAAISNYYNSWHDAQKQEITKEFNRNTTDETKRAYDLISANEEKRRLQYSEYWSEYNSRGIFKQGNDPTIGTFGGGSGTVQYLTEFGERLLEYVEAISKVEAT